MLYDGNSIEYIVATFLYDECSSPELKDLTPIIRYFDIDRLLFFPMQISFFEPKNSKDYQAYQVCFSPDNSRIAHIGKSNEIYILNTDLIQVGFILCPNKIEQFSWSPDGSKILVLLSSKNDIMVYPSNKNQPKNQMTTPLASLSGGLIETERVMWSPSSEQVLIFGISSSQLILWDIQTKKSSFKRLPTPKNSFKSVAFSPNGSTLAVLNRNKNQDTVSIFTSDYVRKTSFTLTTLDAEKIQWARNGQYIVVQDSNDHHLLEVIDLQYNTVTPFAAYEGFLGINEISISPNSLILALGSYDNIIRLRVKTGNTQWKTIEELTHTNEQKHPSVVFSQTNGFRREIPYTIQVTDENDSNGFSYISWSFDNTYLAAIPDKMSRTVFIWNTKEMSPQVIDLQEYVTCVEWSPISNDCLIASNQNILVHWNQKTEVEAIDVGENVETIEWSKDGSKIIVSNSSIGSFLIGEIPIDK